MALANVAVLLSRWGYKTLIVDWDLEAPGLEHFFKNYLNLETVVENSGVVDLLESVPNSADEDSEPALDWRSLLVSIQIPESKIPLYLLTAGNRGNGYFGKLRNFDIETFYSEKQGGQFIEQLRNEWKSTYDFVLIDSRTGITDIGGICTIQLPDVLVLLFTATDQGFEGVLNVARKALQGRQKLPVDRLRLLSIPIPTRFDTDKEFQTAQKWLTDFAEQLSEIYADWLPKNIKARDFLETTKLPYVAYFSFGEKLAVVEQGTNDPTGLGYSYETLSAIIANNLEFVEQVINDRSKFVQTASKTQESVVSVKTLDKELITKDSFNRDESLKLHTQWLDSKGRLGKRLDLSNAILKETDFSKENLSKAILLDANLENADLSFADLSEANLIDANLRNANLSYANLQGTILQSCNLSEARLEYAKMSGANLENSNLQGAILAEADLSRTKIHGANLDEVDFTGATLNDVNFTSISLRNTILRNSYLQGADLSNVSDLREEQLSGTDLNGAKLPEETQKFELLNDFNHREIWLNVRYGAVIFSCIFSVSIELLSRFSYETNRESYNYGGINGFFVPFLGSVDIRLFYLTLPIALSGLYIYIQLYMQGIWSEIAIMPKVFPDGKPLYRKIRPEFIRRLIQSFSIIKDDEYPANSFRGLVIFALYLAVPLIITYYTTKVFLILNYTLGLDSGERKILLFIAIFLFILCGLIFFCGFYFYKLARRTLIGKSLRRK